MKAIEKIEVFKPQFNKMPYGEFPITNSCERGAKLMGEDYVRLVFNHEEKVVFDAFSYIEYNGQVFFLKEKYSPSPIAARKEIIEGEEVVTSAYSYDVKFVSLANMLDKFICYRHVVVDQNVWDEPEINISGTLETMYVIVAGAIEQAANRLNQEYCITKFLHAIYANGVSNEKGVQKPNTENVRLTANTKLLSFSFQGDNIANVCTIIANSFTNDDKKDTEWYITPCTVDKYSECTLHFAKCVSEEGVRVRTDYATENSEADKFAHRYKTGGLKKVEYAQPWSGIPNTIVPYGSDRNMSYESVKGIDELTQMQSTFGKRLRLDPFDEDGYPRVYGVRDKDGTPKSITVDANGGVRNNFVDTGIEQVKFYDDIYPQCHFRVMEITTRNKRQDGETIPEYTITAEPIDTDGYALTNEGFYPITIEEGKTLSVRFESGMLNGREFEIANKTKKIQGEESYALKFTIVADGSIEDGTLIPSGNFIPRAEGNGYEGDKFALFNMKMPKMYVEYAKQELAQRVYEDLVELQTTRPEVKCTSDPTNFNDNIAFGDRYEIKSELFNSEESYVSRVIGFNYKLTTPRDVQFNLASAIMQGTLSQMNDLIADVTHTAGGLEQRAINLSRRGWRDASEVASMLDSLTAEMMLVGDEKNQFAFTSAIECVNVSNKFNHLAIGYGSMQHTQEPYINYANKGWWEISDTDLYTDDQESELASGSPYYVYAVVDETSEPAKVVLTLDEHKGDEAYLLLGILSSEFEGRRVFSRTNGYTAIEGGTITTEQIQDAGRNLIIDFQSETPRIIARGKAKIEGNIEFELNDAQINNIVGQLGEIGGQNLSPSSAFHRHYTAGSHIQFTKLIALEANEKYVCSYGKFEDNASMQEEWLKGVCLVVGLSGDLVNTEKVYRFGDVIEVNSNGRNLYIAWGDYGYVNAVKGTVTPVEETSTEFTQYLDEVMVQKGEIATEYQPPIAEVAEGVTDSKLKSYEYLTKALENKTSIAGGLVATTQIQLQDKVTNDEGKVEYRTNAGISGVKDDNVLFWGGGTYEEAVNAASPDNDFYVGENKTGRQITSLLKKDGQGKVGIFKISDTQAVVDVKDKGRIIIDAAEGNVSIFDKDGNERVEITSSDIDKDSADIRTFSNPIEYSDYTPIKHPDDTNKGELVFQSFTLKERQQYVLEQDDFLTHMYLSYLIGYNNHTLSNVNVKFNVAIKSNSLQKHLLCSVDYNIPDGGITTFREGMLKISIYKIAVGERAPKLSNDMEIGIYDVMATGDVEGYGTNLPLGFSTKKIWFGSDKASDENAALIESELYNIRARIIMNEKTIIGNNGFQVQNKNGFVQILNDDEEGTYVRMLGLPQWSGNLEKGRLCYLRGEDSYLHLVIKEKEPT